MKTGKQTPRLSAKLQADMEKLRSEHADLMASQLTSFRSDLKIIADDALRTIQSDLDEQLLKLRQKWMAENQRRSDYRSPFRNLSIWAVIVLAVVTTLSFAMLIQSYRTSWQALGIERIKQGNATFLILTDGNTTLRRCTWGGEERHCIRIEE